VPSARGSSGEPGTAKDFAALFERQPRRDQRAGAFCRLDDDDTKREPGNQAIAPRKIPRPWLPAERHFGKRDAGRQDLFEQVAVFRRIDSILASGEHGDGAFAKAGAMRRRIDAARQARHDGEASLAQAARKNLRQLHAGRRRIARADHGDRRHGERGQMATHRDERRRVIDHLQALRIAGFANGDERHAEVLCGFELTLGRFPRKDLRRRCAAATRQRGQGLERGAGAAEVIDEGAECARSNVLTADEAQPVEPLLVGQTDGFRTFVHASLLRFRQSYQAV
jgi:hypothetical protein